MKSFSQFLFEDGGPPQGPSIVTVPGNWGATQVSSRNYHPMGQSQLPLVIDPMFNSENIYNYMEFMANNSEKKKIKRKKSKKIKQLKEYEDSELDDLLKNLHEIGHKYHLQLGEDFGFGKSMNEKNNGRCEIVFPEKTLNILLEKGILDPISLDIDYRFKFSKNVSNELKLENFKHLDIYKYSDPYFKIPDFRISLNPEYVSKEKAKIIYNKIINYLQSIKL